MESNEEHAQLERLRYHLSHGCKENLVARLSEWPGVHLIHAVENGGVLKGLLVRPDPGVRRPPPRGEV